MVGEMPGLSPVIEWATASQPTHQALRAKGWLRRAPHPRQLSVAGCLIRGILIPRSNSRLRLASQRDLAGQYIHRNELGARRQSDIDDQARPKQGQEPECAANQYSAGPAATDQAASFPPFLLDVGVSRWRRAPPSKTARYSEIRNALRAAVPVGSAGGWRATLVTPDYKAELPSPAASHRGERARQTGTRGGSGWCCR
jgi:hypothetical protein